MSPDTTAWRIDAWCPLDGVAFASLRDAGILGAFAEDKKLEPVTSVFVSPPYFEPEPIGSIATALGAARGPFQTGFVVAEEEVAFRDLAQLIETVRRAYRAGGGREWPRPGEPPPLPLPSDGSAPALKDFALDLPAWNELRQYAEAEKPLSPAIAEELLRSSLAGALDSGYLSHWTTYALTGWLSRLGESASDADVEACCAWIRMLEQIGVNAEIDASKGRVKVTQEDGEYQGELEMDEPPGPRLTRALQNSSRTVGHLPFAPRSGNALPLLQRIPLPTVPEVRLKRSGALNYPTIPSLGALLALSCADRRLVAGLGSPTDFVPLLLAAACANFALIRRRRFLYPLAQAYEPVAGWLARSLAISSLGTVADDALNAFAMALFSPLMPPPRTSGDDRFLTA